MSASQKVLTPTSVGKFVASIRSVATSSDGLVVCSDCRRYMSDMATTCPHCGTETVAVTDAVSVDASMVSTHMNVSDVRWISLVVLGVAAAAFIVSRIAGL